MQPKFKCINEVWSKPENKQYNQSEQIISDPEQILSTFILHTQMALDYLKTSSKDQANRKQNTQVQTMFNLTLK